ncbi:hypothetical protein KJ758_03870, partial [Patescibacteria group bacterium]|nr:hypothetical protein [Patescibacteria group bacterium]
GWGSTPLDIVNKICFCRWAMSVILVRSSDIIRSTESILAIMPLIKVSLIVFYLIFSINFPVGAFTPLRL